MTNEENIFEDADISEEMPMAEPDMMEDPSDDEGEWVPTVSKESPKERQERLGEKKEMNGKILTIKKVFFTKPRTKKPDGTIIAPKKTQSNENEYYPGKLGIRFAEDNLVEYYPNFHYFVTDEGKVSTAAKINRGGDNAVSRIYKLVVKELGRPEDEIADQEVFDFLVGKKVKIKTEKGTFQGRSWFRNDIVEFVK